MPDTKKAGGMSLMRKALDAIGLPILSVASGRVTGMVRDILCDACGRTLGVVIKEANWMHDGMYIPFQAIHSVGQDYLTVHDDSALTPLHMLRNLETISLVTGKYKLKGKTVVTDKGERLGTIEDVYFSMNWEKLVGYELSNGWITDLTEGRKRLAAKDGCIIGDETLIVPNSIRIQA